MTREEALRAADIAAQRTEPITLATQDACPGLFYAFGASYPDGSCHDGHLDDADADQCYESFEYRPCPFCKNAEYLEHLGEGGHFMPPHGFGRVIPGDYFALPPWQQWLAEKADEMIDGLDGVA